MGDLNLSFPSTDWSAVLRAGGDNAAGRCALAKLLERYLPILQTYLTSRWKISSDRAGDLMQGFAADKVLGDGLLRHAHHTRGKFRSFLIKSLDRYVIDELRKQQSTKRSPGETLSLESDVDTGELAEEAGPDHFEVAWARNALESALQRMREECQMSGRSELWGLFEARLLTPALEQTDPPPYQQLQGQFGFESPEQASNLLITAKRMFNRVLRTVLREYVDDEAEVEEELRHMKQILGRSR